MPPDRSATLGETLRVAPGGGVVVRLAVRQPPRNAQGAVPPLHHLDLIEGRAGDGAPVMRVHRIEAAQRRREGDWLHTEWRLEDVRKRRFLRVRGTSTDEAEPLPDQPGDDPRADLWFYSNSRVRGAGGGLGQRSGQGSPRSGATSQ